jgi:hypothetical protein
MVSYTEGQKLQILGKTSGYKKDEVINITTMMTMTTTTIASAVHHHIPGRNICCIGMCNGEYKEEL